MISEWKEYSLSDLLDIIGGGTPKTTVSEYWDGNIPWLSVKDFNGDVKKVYITEKTITEKGLENSSTKLLNEGDLIISARGTVGEIAQLGKVMAFNQSCYGLRARNMTTNDFMYYVLRSMLSDIKSKTHGSVFDTITRDTFNILKINLPPLTEQKRIAEILSSVDDKIELNNKMNKNLEEMAQAIFKQWLVDFEFPDENGNPYKSSGGKMIQSELGEIPAGWSVKNLGEVCETILGGTPSRENKEFWMNGSINWINSGEVNKFRILEPTEKITELALSKSAAKLMPKRTVVIAITGATLGQVSLTEIETSANQSVIGIIGNEILSSEYLYLWTKNNIEGIISKQTGGAQQHINKNNVNETKLIIPDVNVLFSFNNTVTELFDMIKNNLLVNIDLIKTRDSLLTKLMSGEIRVDS